MPRNPDLCKAKLKKSRSKIVGGRNRLLRERKFCIRNIVKVTIADYKKQQTKEVEQPDEKEPEEREKKLVRIKPQKELFL